MRESSGNENIFRKWMIDTASKPNYHKPIQKTNDEDE